MRPIERRKPATYADLCALPPEVVGEIIDGTLHASPRPATAHGMAASVLGSDLMVSFQRGGGPGGWWFLDEPELHFGDNVLVPDIAGWRRERMPRVPNANFIELAPDWVCEILSPSTASLDRSKKMRVYGKVKVPHVWLVDPIGRTVEVFRLTGDLYSLVTVAGDTPKARLEPFDAIELEVEALWLPLEPEPQQP